MMTHEFYSFENAEQAEEFQQLLPQLRCMGCPNESLLDSKIPVALELKRRIAELMKGGADKTEVKSFLMERYGDAIFYDPPLKATTVVLWMGPWLLLFFVLYQVYKKINPKVLHSSPK